MSDLPPPYTPAPEETKAVSYTPFDQFDLQPQPGDYFPQKQATAVAVIDSPPTGAPRQQPRRRPVIVEQTQHETYGSFGQLIGICCVSWLCCAWPFGLIAFVLMGK